MPSTVLGSESYKQGSILMELTYRMRGSGKKITQYQSVMRDRSLLYRVGKDGVS